MEFKQNFSESDLIELEKIFSKTLEVKSSRKLFWRNRWVKICLFILSGILFLCSGLLYYLEGGFSNSIKLYLIIAVLALCWPFFLDIVKKKKDILPLKMVRSKYTEPFELYFKDDSLTYRKETFLYTSLRTVVEYKIFLFIKANKKWLVIKALEEEKDFMMDKIGKHTDVSLIKKEDIFSLKEFN